MEHTSPRASEDEALFDALLQHASVDTKVFVASLEGTGYYNHYRNLMERYVRKEAQGWDMLRIVALVLHKQIFDVRKVIVNFLFRRG